MIKPSENEIGLFDSSGSAVSIKDLKQFEDEVIKKSPMFKHLIKPDHTVSGGGLAGGGTLSGAAQKPLKQMTDKERIELKRDNPQLFQSLLRV